MERFPHILNSLPVPNTVNDTTLQRHQPMTTAAIAPPPPLPPLAVISPLQQLLTAAFAAAAANAANTAAATNPNDGNFCSEQTTRHYFPPLLARGGESYQQQRVAESLSFHRNYSPPHQYSASNETVACNESSFRAPPNSVMFGQLTASSLRTISNSSGSSCGSGVDLNKNSSSCPLENCRQMLALIAPPALPDEPPHQTSCDITFSQHLQQPTTTKTVSPEHCRIKFSIDQILKPSFGQQPQQHEPRCDFPFRSGGTANSFSRFVKLEQQFCNLAEPQGRDQFSCANDIQEGRENINRKRSHESSKSGGDDENDKNAKRTKAICRRQSAGENKKSTAKIDPLLPDKNTIWPAWVYCTRYSDRPSSGPRIRKQRNLTKKKSALAAAEDTKNDEATTMTTASGGDDKRPRTAFTQHQLDRLKTEFQNHKYLTEQKRQQLAAELNLNESQIKIWFQNKRAKLKKSSGVRNKLAQQLISQGLYNHSTTTMPFNGEDGDDEDDEEEFKGEHRNTSETAQEGLNESSQSLDFAGSVVSSALA